jgi:phospholipase C
MSYFDVTTLPEGRLAQQFTLSDNLFHSAFGGSFLNHQFLIAAAAPVFPNAATKTPSSLPVLDASGRLALGADGKIIRDGKVTPINATFEHNFAVNTIYSVNMVPTFKTPADTDLLPSQNDSHPGDPARPYLPTIGDRLEERRISWKWYAGGWDAAVASTLSNPSPANPATVDPLFQWHHQPFAYYDNFAPFLPSGQRNPRSAAHLQDETNFLNDLKNRTLPHVSFIKPLGPNNEHPGYADLSTGQQHVADLVQAVQQSQYWDDCLIIITYDENGGRWDHVPPPAIDKWGPGARVPAILVGPTVKAGHVDHTLYETDSILALIEHRFHLKPLSTRDAQADPFTHVFRSEGHDRD